MLACILWVAALKTKNIKVYSVNVFDTKALIEDAVLMDLTGDGINISTRGHLMAMQNSSYLEGKGMQYLHFLDISRC